MNRTQTIGAALAATLLLASCTQQEDAGAAIGSDSPLTIGSVEIETTDAATRATSTEAVSSGKLWIGFNGGTSYTPTTTVAGGAVYSYSSGKWTLDSGSTALQLNENPASLCAYYPADGTYKLTEGTTCVELPPCIYSEANDFYYAVSGGAKITHTFPYANFLLQSPYTRLTLSITRKGYVGKKITRTKVWALEPDKSVFEIPNTQTIDLKDGTIAGGSKTSEIVFDTPVDLPQDNSSCTVDLLLPQFGTNIPFLCIALEVDEKLCSFSIPNVNLTKGIQNKIPIEITRTGMGSDGPVDAGYPAEAGIDFYFAPSNLRALPDGKGGYVYSFGDGQGYSNLTFNNQNLIHSGSSTATVPADVSEYFTVAMIGCGSKQASITDSSSGTTTTETVAVYSEATDPCSKVGDGKWRIPTLTQVRAINAYDKTYARTMNHLTVYPCWMRLPGHIMDDTEYERYNPVAGYYFNCPDADLIHDDALAGLLPKAGQDDYLFLPCVGYFISLGADLSAISGAVKDELEFAYLCRDGEYFQMWIRNSDSMEGASVGESAIMGQFMQDGLLNLPIRCVRPKSAGI